MKFIPAFLLALMPVAAQVTTGSVSGVVLDPGGGPVPNARVTVTGSGRALVRSVISDSSGFYRLVELPPAIYELSCSAPSFESATARDVRVVVDSRLTMDFHLALAGLRQSIEVVAAPEPVQASSVELGSVFEEGWIRSLPINRRDFLQLALLAPGALPPVQDSELSTRGTFSMHANGAREEFNNFLLDGVDNNDPHTGRYLLQPSVDAVQEFKLVTNSYSAEYGRNAGGQVNIVTRGGDNAWHGFAYDYLRDGALDSRNLFDASGRQDFTRNQFGGGAGGPAVKDRSFLFASMDVLRERRGLSRLATVPTEAERGGDLSSRAQPVLDPFTRQPFSGNRIPRERISPLTARVLELFPLPNRPGNSGNYLAQPTAREDQIQTSARWDQRLSASDQVMVRYSYGHQDLYEPFIEEQTDVPGFGDLVEIVGHSATVQHARVLSPTAVNTLRAGFGRAWRTIFSENHTKDVRSQWGVNWLPAKTLDFGYPLLNVAGYSPVGDATQIPIVRATNTYSVTEGLALSRGDHAIKLGAEVRRVQVNQVLDYFTRGSLSFSGALTGAGIGDLLLGLPGFGMQSQSDNPQTLRTTATGFFFQDDWKLRGGLTVNLGLRYEYNTPPVDPNDRMAAFDPVSRNIYRVGSNGIPRAGIRADRNNLAPRLGVAWSPGRRTVVRAGYGLFFDSGILMVNSSNYFNPPFFSMRVYFPTQTSLLTLADPFPSRGGMTPPASPNTLSPDLTTSHLQSWNVAVQREIAPQATLTLAYAGSKGTHLIRARDINQPTPGPGTVQLRRPMPQYGSIFYVESGANSNFHSLQATFDRRFAKNFGVWAVYTMSKSIDDCSAFLATKADKNFPQDSRNIRAERAVSSFDVGQRAAVAHVYQLPGLRNTEALGILTVQSGQPFTPILRFDNSNTGNTGGIFGSDRPNLLGDPRLDAPSADRWFNTAALGMPAQYSFGSAGRNILRGPGLFSYDLSLVRRFAIGEKAKLSVEAQGFNLLNRVNLDLPERYADEPGTFGKVFSAKAARQVQFALRVSF